MRNLVQLALPSKNINPRAEPAGPRSGERSFSDALQIKPGKSGVVAGKEALAGAPTPPAPAFRIRIGSHGLTTGLPVAAALGNELRQGIAAGAAIDEPAVDNDDLEITAEEIPPVGKSPDAVLLETAEPEMLEGVPEVREGEPELPEAEHAAPGSNLEAPVIAPPLRLEPGSRPRDQTGAGDEPDAVESPRTVAAEAAKAADRPALASAAANARQSAAPAAAKGDVAAAETEAKPAADPERAATSRGAPPMPVGESRPRIPASVRVVEAQSFPAPPQVPPPAASVTSAIAAAPDWMSFVRSPETAALASSPGAAPVKSLTIQLHPAELGVVTARLRFAGEQLTIELQVERTEAYDRLSTDRETMLKAVRALGIEVDKITVQQPQASNAVNTRSENGSAFNGGGSREPGFSTPGGSGGRESGPNNPQGGTGREEAAPGHHSGTGHGNQNADGRGLYI